MGLINENSLRVWPNQSERQAESRLPTNVPAHQTINSRIPDSYFLLLNSTCLKFSVLVPAAYSISKLLVFQRLVSYLNV